MCHVLRLPLFTRRTRRLESNLLFPSFELGNNILRLQIKEITVTSFGAKLTYEAKRADTTSRPLEPIRLTGAWTKEGKFVEAAGAGENRTFDARKDMANARGLAGNSHPAFWTLPT